jgi:hypothetical protein
VHVFERRHARRLPEAALERSLGQAGEPHHWGDRIPLVVVFSDPRLAARDGGIFDLPGAGKARERLLPASWTVSAA